MTAILDDFNRTSGLGPNWNVTNGQVTTNGNEAESVTSPGFMTAIYTGSYDTGTVGGTYGTAFNHRVKITRPARNDGDARFGIIFGTFDPAQTPTPISGGVYGQGYVCYYRGSTGMLTIETLYNSGAVVVGTWPIPWTPGEAKTLRVYRINTAGCEVFVNDTPITGAVNLPDIRFLGNYPLGSYHAGLYGIIDGVGAGLVPADPIRWDNFRVDNLNLVNTVETAPSCPADPTLTSIAIGGEPSSVATLPVDPDTAIIKSKTYSTRVVTTEAGYRVRHAAWTGGRTLYGLTWTNINDTQRSSLRSFFDARGTSQAWTYAHPEDGSLVLALADRDVIYRMTQAGTYTVTARAVRMN